MLATSVCTHPYGIPSNESAYCPDCKQTFLPGSRGFNAIQKRQLKLPLEPTPTVIDSSGEQSAVQSDQNLDLCLQQALLKHAAGQETIWEPLLKNGATDEQIKRAIGLSFGDHSGSSEPCWWTAKGGKSPQFWCGGKGGIAGTGKPTLSGKSLVQKVRKLLQISELKEVSEVKDQSNSLRGFYPDRRAQAQKPLEPNSLFPEGSRIRVRSSLIPEDIGRTGTVQHPWDNRPLSENDLKILLDGDRLCRAFKPESLELLSPERSAKQVLALNDVLDRTLDRPLEPKNGNHQDEKAIALHEILAQLEQERDALERLRQRLAELAADAPATGWIESGMVKGKDFRQTWWRGVERDGKKTTLYIGKEGSPAHKKAVAAQQARRQLKSVLKQISLAKKELGDV